MPPLAADDPLAQMLGVHAGAKVLVARTLGQALNVVENEQLWAAITV
jgi:hypothetical protein